jgi:uncharacterized membrane protein YdbT with pleckstrin-like domain
VGYPARLLADDERIALELRPHWKALVVPVFVLLVVAAAAGFAASLVPTGPSRRWALLAIAVVGLVVIGRWTIWPWLRWHTTNYVLTTHRLILREGVIARDGHDIPLSRVNDVSFAHSSLLERVLGCGTLTVESGGERGQIVLPSVPHVEDTQRELYRLVDADAGRGRSERADEYEAGQA